MLNALQSKLSKLARAMAWLAGASLVAMVAIVVLDVVSRLLFTGFQLNGAIELATVCVVLLAYFGLPWAFASNAHIIVEVATSATPLTFQKALDAFWLVVSALLCAVFFWLVLDTGLTLHGYGEVTEILRMSPLVAYGTAAFGLLIAVLVALNQAVIKLRDRDTEGALDSKET